MTTHTDTGLAAQTSYDYRVIAFNGVGPSAPSNVATGTTQAFASNDYYVSDREREQSLQNAVTYYPGGSPPPQQLQQQMLRQSPHNPPLFSGSRNSTPGGAMQPGLSQGQVKGLFSNFSELCDLSRSIYG